MKAISVRQPWAWLIVNGQKTIENRTWRTNIRGPVLIHASQTLDHEAWQDFVKRQARRNEPVPDEASHTGGIVGIVEIVDCVDDPSRLDEADAEWFEGPYGFLLRNARPLPFQPIKGKLNFFDVEYEGLIDD
jgi:hypothetical protein